MHHLSFPRLWTLSVQTILIFSLIYFALRDTENHQYNEQECYWQTIYRAGAAVVSTITSNNVNSIVKDSIQEQQKRIPRVRTLTEWGQAYQEDRQRERDKEEDQLIKRFYEGFDEWKRKPQTLSGLLLISSHIHKMTKTKIHSALEGSPRQSSDDIREVTEGSTSRTTNSPKDRCMRCIKQDSGISTKTIWR